MSCNQCCCVLHIPFVAACLHGAFSQVFCSLLGFLYLFLCFPSTFHCLMQSVYSTAFPVGEENGQKRFRGAAEQGTHFQHQISWEGPLISSSPATNRVCFLPCCEILVFSQKSLCFPRDVGVKGLVRSCRVRIPCTALSSVLTVGLFLWLSLLMLF